MAVFKHHPYLSITELICFATNPCRMGWSWKLLDAVAAAAAKKKKKKKECCVVKE
jgi:hypothetical protein